MRSFFSTTSVLIPSVVKRAPSMSPFCPPPTIKHVGSSSSNFSRLRRLSSQLSLLSCRPCSAPSGRWCPSFSSWPLISQRVVKNVNARQSPAPGLDSRRRRKPLPRPSGVSYVVKASSQFAALLSLASAGLMTLRLCRAGTP